MVTREPPLHLPRQEGEGGALMTLGGLGGGVIALLVETKTQRGKSLNIFLPRFLSRSCFKEIESMCVWINCLTPKNVVL